MPNIGSVVSPTSLTTSALTCECMCSLSCYIYIYICLHTISLTVIYIYIYTLLVMISLQICIYIYTFIDHLTNFNSSIKYTHTISANTVTFLDLQLTIDSNHFISCAHFRPTDSHNYLLFSCSHPPSCKQSIPFSQL